MAMIFTNAASTWKCSLFALCHARRTRTVLYNGWHDRTFRWKIRSRGVRSDRRTSNIIRFINHCRRIITINVFRAVASVAKTLTIVTEDGERFKEFDLNNYGWKGEPYFLLAHWNLALLNLDNYTFTRWLDFASNLVSIPLWKCLNIEIWRFVDNEFWRI